MIQLHHLRVRWNSSLANDQRLWQASAHLLALTLHKRYGSDLLLVKSFISNGFHLDFYIAQGNDSCANNKDEITRFLGRKQVQISQSELKSLQKEFLKNTNLIFETKEYVQSEALGKLPLMLKQNVQSDQEKPVKLVKHGSFYDLFVNPFAIPKDIKAAYFHSTGAIKFHHQNQEFTLTRISGISFDSRQKMVDYKQNLADAEKRNHRKIGSKLKLFTFHEFSPGAPFFLPHGTRMVNKLKEYLCGIYVKYGFEEVITPLVYSKELWEISGHWDNYKNDMFTLSCSDHEDKDQIHGLKPMNCPAHCLIFSSSTKSYRELPVRYAEFSPLHRNEASGALTGLTRVRKFHQDDGHVFCTPQQIYDEINASLELVKQVYQQLGFPTYKLTLSTRPNKYLGDLNDWENAEAALTRALNDSKQDWTMKHGDGAFYGPKIDIMVKDSLGREHQTATIQLDFQLPKRFDLYYRDEKDEKARPVIIHRAILGSLERMLAILIENYNGKFPFWLSPRQILVVTTKTTFTAYSKIIKTTLESKGYNVELDVTDKSLGKKIQEASPYGFNYILIVGDKEFEAQTVTVRSREGIDMGEYSLEKLCEHFKGKLKNESLSL